LTQTELRCYAEAKLQRCSLSGWGEKKCQLSLYWEPIYSRLFDRLWGLET